GDPGWNGRGHFFGAAARAMRNILVEQARRKAAVKHGGNSVRESDAIDLAIETPAEDILALDEAVRNLEKEDPDAARVVMLKHFAGLADGEIAAVLDVSERTVRREWRFARAWLQKELGAAPVSEDGDDAN